MRISPMAINVLQAAKYLCQESNWTLTNLEVQKLIYLSHMIYMGFYGEGPLIGGTFQAWKRGPVHPELYEKLRIYKSEPIVKIYFR